MGSRDEKHFRIAVSRIALQETSGQHEKNIGEGVKFLICAGGAILIGVAILGIYSRNAWTLEVQRLTDKAARTSVRVVHPTRAIDAISFQLPGQTMPYTDAPIFAQTSGYLKKWYFDIGAEVKAGAILAEIDTPEVDAQLAQAQAQLRVVQAACDLSKVTYQRFKDLFQQNVIAAQDLDTAADNYGQNQATVIADQANVNRLDALEVKMKSVNLSMLTALATFVAAPSVMGQTTVHIAPTTVERVLVPRVELNLPPQLGTGSPNIRIAGFPSSPTQLPHPLVSTPANETWARDSAWAAHNANLRPILGVAGLPAGPVTGQPDQRLNALLGIF